MQAQASEAPQRSLFRKLAEVMGEVERVKKSGRNEFHRYDYATEADIVAAVREGMSQRHLMLVPDVEKVEVKDIPRQKGGTERLATLTVRFTLVDGDSGETHGFHVIGEGTDQGDKATYKAMTGATKYALLKLFLIPTGDDPELDDAPAAKAQRQPQRPSPAPQQQPEAGRVERPRQEAAREAERVAKAVGGEAQQAKPKEVRFGQHKGRALSTLTDAELSETLDAGNACLAAGKTPDGKPLSERAKAALQDAVVDVELEIDRRMGQAERGA